MIYQYPWENAEKSFQSYATFFKQSFVYDLYHVSNLAENINNSPI